MIAFNWGLPREITLYSLVFLGFFAGFKEQIYDVYRYLPPATQVVLVSATLPHEILEMTSKFMTDPIRVLVKRSVTPLLPFSHSHLLNSHAIPAPLNLTPLLSHSLPLVS